MRRGGKDVYFLISKTTKHWNFPLATKHWNLLRAIKLGSSFTSFFFFSLKGVNSNHLALYFSDITFNLNLEKNLFLQFSSE
jgi:hypothetical protein